jgi:hypothetical protein
MVVQIYYINRRPNLYPFVVLLSAVSEVPGGRAPAMSLTAREPLGREGGFETAQVHGGAEASFFLRDGSIGSECSAPPISAVDQGGTCLLPSAVRGSDQIGSFLQRFASYL